MASQLMGLPPEVRLIIYKFCIICNGPLPYSQIRSPPRDVRSLSQICRLVRKEAEGVRDDFIRFNSFCFYHTTRLAVPYWNAPSRIRALVRSIHLTSWSAHDRDPGALRQGIFFDSPWLAPTLRTFDALESLPNLRNLTVDTGVLDPAYLNMIDGGKNYRKRLLAEGLKRCALAASCVMDTVTLPKDFILRLHGRFAMNIRTVEEVLMQFEVVYRCVGNGAWTRVSVEEVPLSRVLG